MSCNRIRSELVAYHFGVISEEARGPLEEHLLSCRDCLREFLDVKRAVEIGDGEPAPSAAARHRLRRAVARELSVVDPHRPWSWWERPLAFAFAGSAVVMAMMAVRALTGGPGAPPHALSSDQEQVGAATGTGTGRE